ncbi:hypothetical protein DM02DRAFT_537329 [Periconia macrospinosa]|uniref:Carbohydrate-binding module family 18 protein n=1 Tax=Periconia macrospinosa TaxID=97972 RepID=A0A2V1DBK1_9PLEO|nr:hypothetical protein DM02DRAFT_537329 [Periconia macrospinosa]
MQFKLIVGLFFSAMMMTTYGTHVACQAGLSDTNICMAVYCSCSGNQLFCRPGVTCSETCVCAP